MEATEKNLDGYDQYSDQEPSENVKMSKLYKMTYRNVHFLMTYRQENLNIMCRLIIM